MKRLNFPFFIAMLALPFFFTSCDNDDDDKKEVTISFESVTLNDDGYQNNFPDGLILSDVDFYNSYDETYFSWEGFAVSTLTDKETAGYDNQFSVYANGGASGSKKFAVAFDGFYETTNLKFLSEQEYQFKSLMINNATYAALSMKNGDSYCKKFADGDWFKIIITGLDAEGNEKGNIEFYLADFRNGNGFICSEWTRVDLSGLGKVNKLEFTFDSTDIGNYGMNTPAYACIDNIIYYAE